MSYRVQELIRFIIPGIYLSAVIGCLILYKNWDSVADNKAVISLISSLSCIILLLIPFVGFIFGYVIEVVMSIVEHLFYFLGGRRPSKDVLQGYIFKKCRRFNPYFINNTGDIALQLGIVDKKFTNNKCGMALQVAKQMIDKGKLRPFFYSSIFARDIFGGQFIASIVCWVSIGWCGMIMVMLIVCFLFLIYWIHINHVYVKYVLAEYGRQSYIHTDVRVED